MEKEEAHSQAHVPDHELQDQARGLPWARRDHCQEVRLQPGDSGDRSEEHSILSVLVRAR